MKIIKYLLFFWVLTVLILSAKLQAQDIWIGSYLNSSDNKEITYYQNYWQIKQLGLNTVLQRNIVSVPSINQESNFDSLMQFNNIIAINDSAFGPDVNENNVDWIYYFTNALYSKWEAEGSLYFTESELVGVKHNGVGQPASDGWSSGSNLSDINKFFILGPNYSQYMKYVYTNKFETGNPLITYKTNFRIKLAQSQTGSFPIARLIISVKNNSDGTETTLIDSTIYSNQLATTYRNIICKPYNYSDFQPSNNGESNYNGTPPPGPAWYAPQSTASSKFYDENLKIQFKVQKLAQAEVIVDYIEVYDAGTNSIWETWFKGTNYSEMINFISSYNQKFSSLGTKLKYYHTIDEPHSIDCFYPIKKIQSILDSLNTGRDLLTHFYPGWDNNRDGVNILEKWYKIVQPKKLMFWYFPFSTDATDEFGLRAFRGRLKEATILQNGFYSTLQSWGYRYNNNPYWFRTPTPNEIGAEVMLALSSGAKGIFFEPYYSYTGWLDELDDNIEVEAIVGKKNAQGNFPPRDIYYKIQQLNNRLDGKLGSTLSKLKHTNHFVNNTYPNPGEPQITQYEYFQLITSNNSCDWYAGFMYDSIFTDRNYFLITNLRTDANRTVNFNISNTNFNNLSFGDVENTSNPVNTTLAYNETRTITMNLPAGEGYLFQVAPVVKYGGLLAYNDTIKTSTTLSDDMTIDAGKILQINEGKIYTITDTITFTDTSSFITGYGYINRTQNGWIITRSWNKSLFRGRSGSHPKLIWSKHPDITNVIDYKIYRNHSNGGWQYLTTKSSSIFEYIDSTITIIEGMSQANETSTQYRITATHRPTKDLVETSPTNTILYHRVEGQGLEKQNSGSTSNDFTYNLDQNYPNPFNPSTKISYQLRVAGNVTLKVYDLLGREVATLVNEEKNPGNYDVEFNALQLSSGVYIYKIQVGSFINSKKMIFLK